MATLKEIIIEIANDPRTLALDTGGEMWDPLTYLEESYGSLDSEVADEYFGQEACWSTEGYDCGGILIWDESRDQWKSEPFYRVVEGHWDEEDSNKFVVNEE